jgi:NitT/TauT family transport system ATP-binding protein
VQALRDVNLTINKGDFVSFIGPSGCGKTTFLRVVADLERPTGGAIIVAGMTPEEARRARAYGYVFQAAGLYPWRTIARNVALPLEIMGYPGAEQEACIRRTLATGRSGRLREEVPLAALGRHAAARQHRPRAGLRRRPAADGRAFGALDEIVRDHLNEQLLALWAKTKRPSCFVTHSIPEAVYLSTKIVVMSPRPGGSPTSSKATCRRAPARHPRHAGVSGDRPPGARGLRAGHAYDD